MELAVYEEMKKYVQFSKNDQEKVWSLRPLIEPFFGEVTSRFYDMLLQDPTAKAVFTGGGEQIEHQRTLLTGWLTELFRGPYEAEYFRKRIKVGTAHVRVGLPPRYMCVGMQLIWQELERVIRRENPAHVDEKLVSLHKLLMLDLSVMLESYGTSYAEQVRADERTAVEERLTRAEHLAEIGQLAASLAHEIKNPLAGISGAIQVIRDELGDDDPHRNVMGEVLGQIHRLDAAVRDLLMYARPTPPKAQIMSLTDTVHRMLRILAEEPAMHHVDVVLGHDGRDALILADRSQVEQLLLNLLINAAHASRPGQTIRVDIAPGPGKVRLCISDSGVGMTPEVRRRAFEPFFTTKTRGTGLGLSICRRIIETHNGTIDLESTPGLGTVVNVEFPSPTPSE